MSTTRRSSTRRTARRPARRATTARNTVKVGRFGYDPVSVIVPGNATIERVLEKANIELGVSEKVWLNGSRATLDTKVKRGDIVSVVTPKEAGIA